MAIDRTRHRFAFFLSIVLFVIGTLAILAGILVLLVARGGGVVFVIEVSGAALLGAALCFSLTAILRLLVARVQQGEDAQRTLELLRLQLVESASRTLPSAALPGAVAASAPATPAGPSAKQDREENAETSRMQTLELLQQIRDVAMMNDSQLEHVASRHWAQRKEVLCRRVERHMLSGDWATAKTRLEELQALLPEDVEVQQLGRRVSEEHALRLDEDLKTGRSHIKQLSKISAWAEAEEVVAGLQRKYPQDREVEELAREITENKKEAERETRERLLADVTNATDKHDWNRGAAAVEEFLMRFPTDKIADRLRFDLLTLRENAGAQERKEQEALFKDLLKRHEYEKAETLAKGLIAKYPASPTAAELTKLLPKVEELIQQEKLQRGGMVRG